MNFRLLILMIAVLAWPLGTSKPAQSSEAWSYSVRQSSTRAPDRSAFERRVAAEKELNKKFVLILKLNDQQIERLRLNGSLSTKVPPRFVNRVKAVRIKRATSFRSKPLSVAGARTQRSNRSVSLEIDNSVLERLAYQPVDIRIYETGFDLLRLKFNPRGNIAGELPQEFEPLADQSKAPYMYARINDRRGIYGSLVNFEALSIKTQFGQVKIPGGDISGIRFNDGDPKRAFVVLKKGDFFSGEIDFDSVTLKSRWGNQTLKVSELESLTLNREHIFLRDAIEAKRWQLRSSIPLTGGVPSAPQSTISFDQSVLDFNQNPPSVGP